MRVLGIEVLIERYELSLEALNLTLVDLPLSYFEQSGCVLSSVKLDREPGEARTRGVQFDRRITGELLNTSTSN